MAKKKKKLPKSIAGVKVPKTLRKSGGKLIEAAATPAGRELIAAGLIAAGTALAKAQKARHAHGPAAEVDPAERGAQVAGQIGAAVSAAATAALDRLFGSSPSDGAGEDAPPAGTRAH